MGQAGRLDIVIEEASDFDIIFVYLASRTSAVDVTGFGALLQIRRVNNDPVVIYQASVSDGRITVSGNEGKFAIKIPASAIDSPPIGWDEAVWDFYVWPTLADPTTNPKRLVGGKVSYSPRVSRVS